MKNSDFDSDSADTYSVVSTYSHFSDGFADFYQNNGNAISTPVSIEKCRMSFVDSAAGSRDDLESMIGMPYEVTPNAYPNILIDSPVLENSASLSEPPQKESCRLEDDSSFLETLPLVSDENNNYDGPQSTRSIPEELKTAIDSFKVDYECFPVPVLTKRNVAPKVQDACVNTLEENFPYGCDTSESEKYIEVVPSGRRICIYIFGFDLNKRHELDKATMKIRKILEDKYVSPNGYEVESLEHDEFLNNARNIESPIESHINDSRDDPVEWPQSVSKEEKLISLPPVAAIASHTPRTPKQKQKLQYSDDKLPNVLFDEFDLSPNYEEATLLWNKIAKDLQFGTDKTRHASRKEATHPGKIAEKQAQPSDEKSPFGFLQKVISARINSVINNSAKDDSPVHSGKEPPRESIPKISNNLLYKLCLNSVKKGSEKETSRHLSDRRHRLEGSSYLKRKPLPNIPSPTRESSTRTGPFHLHRRSASKAEYMHRSSRMNDARYKSFDSYRYGNQKYESFSYGRPSTTQEHIIPQKLMSARCKFSRLPGGYHLRATSAVDAVDTDRKWRP